jgi:hypothetical protein
VFVEVHRAEGSDKQFIDLTASHKVARILCLDGHQFWDCFGCVTVLDKMKSFRDECARNASGRLVTKHCSRAVIAKELLLDNTCSDIVVPSIAGHPARSVYVVLTAYKSAVRMELTEASLMWLSKVVAAERALGATKHAASEKATELRDQRDHDPTLAKKRWVSTGGVCRAVRPVDPDEPPSKKRTITWLKPE